MQGIQARLILISSRSICPFDKTSNNVWHSPEPKKRQMKRWSFLTDSLGRAAGPNAQPQECAIF